MSTVTSNGKNTGMSRRRFLKVAAGSVMSVGVTGIGGSAYITRVEPHLLTVSRVTVPLSGLATAFDGLTIAQFSDIHLGQWMNRERLMPVVNQVNDLKPDVIAITGDFVTVLNAGVTDDLVYCLSQLQAREKVLAILGNHDHWTNAATVRKAVAATKIIQLLDNDHVKFERSGEALYIAGVDDIWEQKHDLDKALRDIPDKAPVVLMAHEPDYADEVTKTGRVALQISGHTHGGQFRLPFIGALVGPYLGQKYSAGLYNIDGMALYVNRGVGMVAPLVRFNCPPEITLYTLRAKSAA